METSVNDVLIVIGLDFLLFLLLFLGFAVYRKLRSKKIEIELDVSVLKPYMHEAEYSSFEIAGKVKNMSLTEIYSEVGEWAFVYLNIHKFMAISLLILSVPGCCVLLVLYTYGDEEDEYKDIQKTGISSIIKNPDFLIVPAIFLVVFSLALYVYGWFFLKVILNTKPRSPALVTDELTVMVKGIPKDFSSEFVSAIIEKNLRNDYFKSLINVYTVPHWIDAFSYYRKFLECEKKLKFLMFDLQCSGKRPVIRKFCKKIDGIEFYEMEKNRNLKKVAELKKEFKHMNAGVAFVQFSNRTAAKMLLMAGMNPSQAMNPVNWECSAAPVSCDLIWENLGIDISYAIFRKILINFLFIIAFLVLITPSYLEAIIKKYLDYLNLTSLIVGTLAVSLPSLILVIYQLIILPPAVNFMVQQEKHTKKHLQISSRLRKYFFFLLFYTLFFPILGLQFIGFIELFVEGNWKFELGTKVNMTGQLFFIFLIHQAFLKNGFDLLVASKYIWSATKAILASTNAEKKICYEAEPFEFDFELAVALNTFCITCSLSLIFPLVLLPGLLFFTMRYFIHKYNILSVFYVDKRSSALPSLMTVMFGVFLSSFLMQLLTGATLALCEDKNYKFFGQITILVAFALFILICLLFRSVIKRGRPQSEAFLFSDSEEFKHPMDYLINYLCIKPGLAMLMGSMMVPFALVFYMFPVSVALL